MLDLDDTLFLERDYVKSGFQAVGNWVDEHFAIPDFAQRAWQRFLEGYRGNIFNVVFADSGCEPGPNDIASMISVYRQHIPTITLLPDAAELLEFSRNRFQLALISDGFVEAQQRKLKALGIDGCFALTILTGKHTGWSKPNAAAFLHVQDSLGGSAERFCYVADNPLKDFSAPRHLGWTAIRIRRDEGIYSGFEPLPGGEPHSELSDLRMLQQILSIAFQGTEQLPGPNGTGVGDGNVFVRQKSV